MRFGRILRHRVRSLLRRSRTDAEMRCELDLHLDQLIKENIAAGMSAHDARLAALVEFGPLESTKEQCRDTRRVRLIEDFTKDLAYAFRTLRKSPGFTLTAVVSLALGIAATTAIFGIVNVLLLRPIPFPQPGQLVALFATTPERGVFRDTTSFPDIQDWQSQSHSFTSLAAYRLDQIAVTGDATAELLTALRASHELFRVLAVNPAMGRIFDAEEQKQQSRVALISQGLWTRRFARDPQIIGKTVTLDDESHTIVGVLPSGFQFPPFSPTDVLVPIPEHANRSRGYLRGIARLNPTTPMGSAQREMDAIAARLELAYPDNNRGRGVNVMPLADVAVGDVRTALLVLLGAAVSVLLIGCANVGNLVLAKNIARRREWSVRSALGAGTGRLIRQLFTESVSLALLAVLLGAMLAFWAHEALAASLTQRFGLPNIPFDWTLLVFAASIAILAGALCALPPALMIARRDLDALKQDGRGQSAGREQQRLRSFLMVAETALTLVLLVGAGLLLKSFLRMHQTNLGLDPQNVLNADMLLSKRYADIERRQRFASEILESVRTLPGVRQAAVMTDPPLDHGGSRETFSVEGHSDPRPDQGHVASFNTVSADFFRATGIQINRGRAFTEQDTPNSEPVAIINETLARQFWQGEDPIGKRLRLYYDKEKRWLSIVGVASDVRYRGVLVEPMPQLFLPFQQPPNPRLPYQPTPVLSLVVRTSSNPSSMIPAVRAAIWSIDKDQTIAYIETMEQGLANTIADRRIYLFLLGSFAVIAWIMAAAGVYGLISYAVARRTQEIGIRVALGASASQILAFVLRHSMLLTLLGVGLGVAGSLAMTSLLAGLLFEVTATDAPTFLGVVLLFTAVSFVATYIPARRATKIDPTIALRSE